MPAESEPLTRYWQDAEGTIPALKDGDPVGRVDTNGIVLVQSDPSKRPVLRLASVNAKPIVIIDPPSDFLWGPEADTPIITEAKP